MQCAAVVPDHQVADAPSVGVDELRLGGEIDQLLQQRATEPAAVYTHKWRVGDLVIWDNRGVLHRATPYREDSGREMHRVTLVGDEPIR